MNSETPPLPISDEQLNREIAKLRGWEECSLAGIGMVWAKPNGGISPLRDVCRDAQFVGEVLVWLRDQGRKPGLLCEGDTFVASVWRSGASRETVWASARDTSPGRALAVATCRAYGRIEDAA